MNQGRIKSQYTGVRKVLRGKRNGRCKGAFGRGFKRAKSATEKGEK